MMRALEKTGGLMEGSEFTQIVRTLWVYSMHGSATYHNELSTLTLSTKLAINTQNLVVVVKQEILQIFEN